jgi:tryptophan synthase beta chain
MQDEEGQMRDTHSISAGLDYIGVGPILAWLHQRGRVRFEAATDKEVIEAFKTMVKNEGMIPALESSHAVARALQEAAEGNEDDVILINLSGRGDKDIFTIADALGDEKWRDFLREKVKQYGEN